MGGAISQSIGGSSGRKMKRHRHGILSSQLSFTALSTIGNCFYLPGVAPKSYKIGDPVPLHVNHLTPSESQLDAQVRSVISFDYYNKEFHFCVPKGGPQYEQESLGSILFGDRIQTSSFDIRMGLNETCKAACGPQIFSPGDAKLVNKRINQGYDVNWYLDGLPAGQIQYEQEDRRFFEVPGFPLGDLLDGSPALNNHHVIFADYHKYAEGMYRVVGVSVFPYSISSHYSGDGRANCDSETPIFLSEEHPTEVLYTYSVLWHESATPFATRWDKYLKLEDPRIHWFSLINSTVIVLILLGTLSMIILRALRRDIARYNRLGDLALQDLSSTALVDDNVLEDSGWKLIHGDVFRQPSKPLLLSVLIGNGAQLFVMAELTILFTLFGFLSPSNRGSLSTAIIIFYTLLGFVGGFVSSKVYRFFSGEDWKTLALTVPTALPAATFGTFFILNLFVWARGSSGAVPFFSMLLLVLLWFMISIPLSLAGSWAGYKARPIKEPTRTNQIPRQIPPVSAYLRPVQSMLFAGILPFGAIFVELYFVLRSIWVNKFYYMFGFLFICYGLMVLTCAATTVLIIYSLLCAENYHWQWRSFLSSGSTAIYVFLYAMLYWMRTMTFTSWTSGVLYLGYSLLISALFFVLTGCIGFFASWVFVLKVYRSIKVD